MEVPLNSAMESVSRLIASLLALGALLVGAGFGALVFVNGTLGAAATIVLWTFRGDDDSAGQFCFRIGHRAARAVWRL